MLKRGIVVWCAALVVVTMAGVATADWSEDFEAYAPGSMMIGQGGWEGWYQDPNADAMCVDTQAHGGNNSVECTGSSDLVHPGLNVTSGVWTLTVWHLIAENNVSTTYFVANNEYDGGLQTAQWSIEVQFGANGGLVVDALRNESNVINTKIGEWVELRFEIDLDANTMQSYYDGQLLSDDIYNIRGGALALENIDLYSGGPTEYFDDLNLVAASSTTCSYTIKKNSKGKQGCEACPAKDVVFDTGVACDDINTCAKKFKAKNVACPDGGVGFCKKIVGVKKSGSCG
jgi:hypothetical protein